MRKRKKRRQSFQWLKKKKAVVSARPVVETPTRPKICEKTCGKEEVARGSGNINGGLKHSSVLKLLII